MRVPNHHRGALAIAIGIWAIIAALPRQAPAQTAIPLNNGKTLLGNNPVAMCYNSTYFKQPCPCPTQPGGTASGMFQNPLQMPAWDDLQVRTCSFIPAQSLNYHHYALDYWPGEPAGGCGSCAGGAALGGSELSKLFIQRRHRYRDMTAPSSFGPGVFCNYDVSVQFEPVVVMVQNPPYGYVTSTAYRVEMFDPMEANPKFLVDGVDGDVQDGIYTDQLNVWVKDFRCYDANSNLVVDPNQATTAVLTNWPGYKYTFELINLDPPATNNLMAAWTFDEGSGTTANDTSGNGNTGTLVNGPAWVQGKLNDALQFAATNYTYVDIGNPGDLNFAGPITLAAWVNLPSLQTSSGTIIAHGSPMGSQKPYLALDLDLNGYMRLDTSTGSSVVYQLPSTDQGAWVHWAAVYDGANWVLYHNGQQVTVAATPGGAVVTTDNWTIGAAEDQGGHMNYLNGSVDDVRIYSRGLSPGEIATLAQQKTLAGRLKSITDRNGYAVNITHKSFTQQQISQSPDLQWQINTVTDPYGRQATFSYLPTQVSGRWVVNQITFPNSHKAVYGYANGQIASVAFDDGTTSTFTYGTDATSGCSTIGFFDVAADGTHRGKTAYLTNNFVTYYPDNTGEAEQVLNQSSLLIRMVANGSGEIAYLSLCGPYDPVNWTNDAYTKVYEGAGKLKAPNAFFSAAYLQDGWTLGDPTQGYNAITGTTEPAYATMSGQGVEAQEVPNMTDSAGHSRVFAFDGDQFMNQATWSDNTTEAFSYNQFKQVTRYQDRSLNVTLNTYDAQGNLLSREVGIKNVNGVDTHQPEYAKYQWTYYPQGDPNQYLMASAIDANSNSTNFYYDTSHRLIQVVEPPDVAQGARATTNISYDTASRVQQIEDPETRTVQYAYDQRDRVSTITYGDSSTEQFFCGSPGSGNENLLVKRKDRNGVTTRYDFDASGRLTTTTYAYSTIINGTETLITDPSVQVTKTCTYLSGTDLVASCTERGETTSYGYDYRQRLVSTTVQPRVGVSLTSTRTYLNNLLFSEKDPYGRIKYFGYRSSDGALIREIQGTVPSFTLADFTAVTNQTRSTAANATYLITDYTLDNIGERTAIIDGNNITLAQTFDSRSQLVQRIEASGTAVAATTGFLYDADGNTIEIRSPRYYDTSDPQVGNCRVQKTYTGRNLLSASTEAPGTSVAATVQYQYNLDGTEAKMTDARSNSWQTLWSPCCAGRVTSKLDPLSAGSAIEYDYAGNVTYVQVLQGTTVYNQIATQYDARRRPIFRTVWLVNPPAVNPDSPPIAGQNGVPAANGLTTQWYFDENLADSVGLSAAAGEAIPGVGNVSIQPLLAEIQADGITFGAGSDGYAILEIEPDGQLLVTIQDGASRTVATGVIQPPTGQNPNQPITWHATLNDTVATVSSPGNLLETAYIDALDNTSRRRVDGAGRTIQAVDAESNITTATFDANSSKLSESDPNSVGYTAVFDARNRETSHTDTMNAQTQTIFDANSNRVKWLDAKSNSSTAVFDARDRRVSLTDRIGGTTSWSLDPNSNVLSITDSESRATTYTYSATNKPLTETYADNNPPAVTDQQTLAYDGIDRVQTLTKQDGSYVTFVWDQANRMTARQYRNAGQQPTDPPVDSDTFTFDGASHLISAASGRYANMLVFTYDQAGRLVSEALTVSGQTYIVGRGYDAASRVVSLTYPDRSAVSQAFTPRRLLQQVSYRNGLAASFTYDAGGRRSTRTLGDGPATKTTWGYVAGGNLLASITTPNLPSFNYTWDPNRNKTAETATSVLQSYGFSTGATGYDKADRLVAWNRADGNKNDSWTLTNVGDWQQFVDNGTTHNRTHNGVHELTTSDSATFSYDQRGNLTSNGLTGAACQWDADDHLRQVTVGGQTVSFTYDALWRRVTKTSGGQTSVYVCANKMGHSPDIGLEVAEYAAGAAPAAPARSFVFDYRADEPICMQASGVVSYYHRNGSHSTAAITDSTGALTECYAYSAVGGTTILAPDGVTMRSTSTVGNPYMYTSRRFDIDAGLYYFRARYYDTGLGRFLSRDPDEYTHSDYNLYRYCRNSPLTYYDPRGTFAEPEPQPAVEPAAKPGGCNVTWEEVYNHYHAQWYWEMDFYNSKDGCLHIPRSDFTAYLEDLGCRLGGGTWQYLNGGCVGMCGCLINCGTADMIVSNVTLPDGRPGYSPDYDAKDGQGRRRCFVGKNARQKAEDLARRKDIDAFVVPNPQRCMVFAKQGSVEGLGKVDPDKPYKPIDPHLIIKPPGDNQTFNYVTVIGEYCVYMNHAAGQPKPNPKPQLVILCKSPSCEPRGVYDVTAWCVVCTPSCRGVNALPIR